MSHLIGGSSQTTTPRQHRSARVQLQCVSIGSTARLPQLHFDGKPTDISLHLQPVSPTLDSLSSPLQSYLFHSSTQSPYRREALPRCTHANCHSFVYLPNPFPSTTHSEIYPIHQKPDNCVQHCRQWPLWTLTRSSWDELLNKQQAQTHYSRTRFTRFLVCQFCYHGDSSGPGSYAN